jgi:hypothetical protein
LATARGGDEILGASEPWFSAQDQTTVDDFVRLWKAVRDWIRRRVPAQITEVDDPVEALERLKRHLQALGERLQGQEGLLRGASEDVARGIDVHLRSAQRQVRALNRELDGVRFGTITGIRIRLSRDDRMEAVLAALRRGSAQELLFVPSMPIEEALDELFTRYGGRGETLGRRLLDYREYVEIVVEVLRTTSTEWKAVNPSRLSTGEAIGVGTATMMRRGVGRRRFRRNAAIGSLHHSGGYPSASGSPVGGRLFARSSAGFSLTGFAGTPTWTQWGFVSFVSIEPAPTIESSATVVPARIVAWYVMRTRGSSTVRGV